MLARLLSLLPIAFGFVSHLAADRADPSVSTEKTVVDAASLALSGLGVVSPDTLAHPAVQSALGDVHNALVDAATVIEQVHTGVIPPAAPTSAAAPATN